MNPNDPVLALGLILVVVLMHAAMIFYAMNALWRLLIVNPAARMRSDKSFREGSPFNTRHGMVTDRKTGLCRPYDTLHVTGTENVVTPALIALALFALLYATGLLAV